MLPLSEMSRNNHADVAAAALAQREGIGLASAMMLLDVTNVTPAAHRQPSCKQATPVIGRRLEIVDARFIGGELANSNKGKDTGAFKLVLLALKLNSVLSVWPSKAVSSVTLLREISSLLVHQTCVAPTIGTDRQ